MVSYFFNVLKRVVFERASPGITSFELYFSNIITEKINIKVTKLIKKYVYCAKEVEMIIETRMRQHNKTKTKTTQVILADPNSLTQHIKRANIQAYYWMPYMNKDIQKYDPCLSVWKREGEQELSSLCGVTVFNCLG